MMLDSKTLTWDELAVSESNGPITWGDIPPGVTHYQVFPPNEPGTKPRLLGAVVRRGLARDPVIAAQLCVRKDLGVEYDGGPSIHFSIDQRLPQVLWTPYGNLLAEAEAEQQRYVKPQPFLLYTREGLLALGDAVSHDTVICEKCDHDKWYIVTYLERTAAWAETKLPVKRPGPAEWIDSSSATAIPSA